LAGSWEIKDHFSVAVGILHTEHNPFYWAMSWRNLLPHDLIPIPVAGQPYDMARNVCCMRALEMGVDYLFFLDSDVLPPNDAILRLARHKLPIVSGVYARRSPPLSVPVMQKDGTWVNELPPNSLIEVDVCGAGCLLISREFLQKLPPIDPDIGKHWFSWRVDRQSSLPPGKATSEDFSMNLWAKEVLGISTFVDTSVVCGHIGLAESKPGKFGAVGTV